MSLHFIIDGYNIINHPWFPRAGKRSANPQVSFFNLIKTKKLCGSAKNKASVVFDGYPKDHDSRLSDEQINFLFSYEQNADEVIKKLIESTNDKKNLIVVTDDKEIRLFAKLFRVKPFSAEEFLARLSDKSEKLQRENEISKKKETKEELNYTQKSKINEELSKLWLR